MIDVTTRLSAGPKEETKMTTFTINEENEIVAFDSAEAAAAATATPFDSFCHQQEFAELTASWPAERLVAIWNSLTGVVPVKKFRNSSTGVKRIWEQIERLGESVKESARSAEGRKKSAPRQAKRGARGAKAASTKGRSGKKVIPAKRAPLGRKAAKEEEQSISRTDTKTAQVVTMLQRQGGATLIEIMEKMNWQRHTVRGFMAGTMKKAGHTVESFKPEGGERTYRLGQ